MLETIILMIIIKNQTGFMVFFTKKAPFFFEK